VVEKLWGRYEMTVNITPVQRFIADSLITELFETDSDNEVKVKTVDRYWSPIPYEVYEAVEKLASNPKTRFSEDPYRMFADAIGFYPKDQPLPHEHKWSMAKILRATCEECEYKMIFTNTSHNLDLFEVRRVNQTNLSEYLYLSLTLRNIDCAYPIELVTSGQGQEDLPRPTPSLKSEYNTEMDDDKYVSFIMDWKQMFDRFNEHNAFCLNVFRTADKVLRNEQVREKVTRIIKNGNAIQLNDILPVGVRNLVEIN